jgi:membrane-associated phospholipid phosphatase
MLCLYEMDDLITFIAKYFILIPIFVAIYIFLKLSIKKRQEMLIMLFCVGVLSIIFAKIGSHIYNDPRPYIKDGTAALFAHGNDPNGFPSDHTLLASFLGFVTLYYSRKLGVILLIVAALIGWARVAAHVHHLVDIIGSFVCTGLAYLIVVSLLKNKTISTTLKLHKPEPKNSPPSRHSHE